MGDINGFNRKFSKKISENNSGTRVFVSGFETTVNEDYLQLWFTKLCRGVKSVKIAKDEYGNSLGFCTICFYRPQDAERAIRVTNNREMNGRILRVKLLEDVELQSETFDKCVFVKGFGETLDDIKLEMYFKEQIGNVLNAEVAKYENGASKGYGKVQFSNHISAITAVFLLNGVKVCGNILTVESFKSKEQRSQEPNRNVYVKGFGTFLDDEDLRTLFEKFGEIDSAKVEKDVNGKHRGFGYVCFKRYEDAVTAISKMNGKKFGSMITLTVLPHQSKEERQKEIKNKNLHVRNLHESVTESALKELFASYGKVLSISIKTSPLPGINQGYVCFETSREADNAVAALHLHSYKGLKLKVSPHMAKNETRIKEFDDTRLELPHCHNDTLQIQACKKKNAYKSRSKSLGNLTKSNAHLQPLVQFDEGSKSLGHTKSEVPSLIETSTKNLTNSEQAQITSRLTAESQVSQFDEGGKPLRRTKSEGPSSAETSTKISPNFDQAQITRVLTGSRVSQSDEGEKSVGCTEIEVPSSVGTSAKISTNSDQAHITWNPTGSQTCSSNKIRQTCSSNNIRQKKLAANFQVRKNSKNSESEMHLMESYIPSHTVVKFTENQYEKQESTANEAKLRTMPMTVLDLLEETRMGLLQSTLKSEERHSDNASQNVCLPRNTQSPPTVIPMEEMNSHGQRAAKKAYICGKNVKKN